MPIALVASALHGAAWRDMRERIENKAPLRLYATLKTEPGVEDYLAGGYTDVQREAARAVASLRAGGLALECNTGRFDGTPEERRFCQACDTGEVGDVPHFLLHCERLQPQRERLWASLRECIGGECYEQLAALPEDAIVAVLLGKRDGLPPDLPASQWTPDRLKKMGARAAHGILRMTRVRAAAADGDSFTRRSSLPPWSASGSSSASEAPCRSLPSATRLARSGSSYSSVASAA